MADHKICKIDGCGKTAKCKGLCSGHYGRLLTKGDPMAGGEIVSPGDVMEWLRAHANHIGDDCLISPYGTMSNGYACVRLNGRSHVASRVMCILAHGDPDSPRLQALHSCGNGHLGCVNPRHLRWGTAKENMQDATDHGASVRKLSHGDVFAIRADIRGNAEIARQYAVSSTAINRIKCGKMWVNLK